VTQPAPPHLDAALQERIHQLWDEVSAFEASEWDAARIHLLESVARMVEAENAYWVGAVRVTEDPQDSLLGWRPRLIQYLRPLPNDDGFTQQRLRDLARGRIDALPVAHAQRAGTFRANRMCDLVPADWFHGDTYKDYLGRGIHDSLVVVAPITPMAEAYYGFLRMRADDPFTNAQRDIAWYAMRGLTWFHRQVLLAHGLLVARTPLSPMERRVAALLLTDRSEKLMAAELGIAASTLHGYVGDVLRKFGVSGRNGLIALWLGRQG